ncbi:cytosolic sulfotransferase 12-like isoform X5 [Populus trichocarpa]|uniref:cytosolic sulfotransferase 12-like isoform X5 n=1 Tax=Populus trichocarpa TaxID=3694 RepID=UPI0022782FBB|nr:cytosolic sulfotransferase 12-like isoform X5 [Populus trichocarpa]
MPNPEQSLSLPGYLQENETSQEFRDLIVSIPTEKGWIANHLHQYQGFWHTTRQLQGVLACQKHLQAQDGDIFLVTTPKSGSTWLKAVMFALVNRVSFPDTKQHPLLTNNPHALLPFLEMEYIGKENLDFTNYTFPRLFSTHLPLLSLPRSVEDSECKLVYLCRNPKDIFVSLWHFTNKLRPIDWGASSLEETFDKFCRGVNLYGPFWDHVLGYWKESLERPHRVFFLKYEEMKNEPRIQLRRLSEFLGCPFSLEEENSGVLDEILELCSFENLSNLEVNKIGKLHSGQEHQVFFRRGEVGDSMNYLTAEMVGKIDMITEQKLHCHGLKF